MKLNAAFWKWFGDSKVVDKHGEPLVVYHAGRHNFNVFDVSRCELGCHFGTKAQAMSVHKTHIGTTIKEFYLSIKNPLRMRDHTGWDTQSIAEELMDMGIFPLSGKVFSANKVRAELLRKGYDGIVYLNRHEGLTDDDLDAIDFAGLDIDGHASDAEMKKAIPQLDDSWIVFKPTQIKFVDNDGTWDVDDADIRSNPSVEFNGYVIEIDDLRDSDGKVSVWLSRGGEQVEDAYAEIPIYTVAEMKNEASEMLVERSQIRERSGNVAYLRSIEIPKKIRGHGIGQKMIESSIDYIRSIGLKSLYLVTSNYTLVEYYSRIGFDELDSNPLGQTLMRLDLKS